MDVYKIVYNGQEDEGVYGISIVDEPANEMKFVAMNKDIKPVILESNKEKQILTGVVLIPDQLILRREGDYEYNIVFEEEVIEKLSQDFLRRGFVKNSKYNHEGKWLEGISVVESWIVYDNESDKAKALGFDVPNGTWLVSMKLSDELWNEYVKTGKVAGFSIDAFLEHKKVKMKTKNKKSIMSLLNKFVKMLTKVNLKEIVVDGNTLFSDDFEVGSDVMVDIDGEVQPLANTSFEYEGFLITTDEDGIIISKEAIEATVEAEVTEDSAEVVEEAIAEIEEILEEILDEVEMKKVRTALQKRKVKMELTPEEESEVVEVAEEIAEAAEEGDVETIEDKIAELEEIVEALKNENEELKKKYEEMSKKPSATKLKANNVNKTDLKGKAAIIDLLQKNK
jgi:hypothetical protein